MTRREIEHLRKSIEKIDDKMLDLVAQRERFAAEIGLVKEKDGKPLRDRVREDSVKAIFAKRARQKGINPVFAKALAEILISDSLRIQRVSSRKDLLGKTALIVGGSGRMGAWLCRRFSNRGADVVVWDPRGKLEGYKNVEELETAAHHADIVVIAGPLGTCPTELERVVRASPQGLVFDVCSVKSHIVKQLRNAATSGMKVASAHPMFGPNTPSPKGRNIILCDCGSPIGTRLARKLFSGAGANVVDIPLESHDALMAHVLGLPHICSLLFGRTLADSGDNLRELRNVEGSSFERMVDIASEVSRESVRVYHDIQVLNPATRDLFTELEDTLSDLKEACLAEDPAKFRIIMESNKKYLEAR